MILNTMLKVICPWIGMLKVTTNLQDVFAIFAQRYAKSISELKNMDMFSSDAKVNSGLDLHIEEEWEHFFKWNLWLMYKVRTA